MRRYEGGSLGPSPRIAVITNDALGNYVVSTPLLQALRQEHHGSEIHYFSGPRTEELWQHDESIQMGESIFGVPPSQSFAAVRPNYDLVVNVESSALAKAFAARLSGPDTAVVGPTLDDEGRAELPFSADVRGDLWRDRHWIASDLPGRYPFLGSGFIGEIFVRLAYIESVVPEYRVYSDPTQSGCDVLIAMSASLPEKLWPTEAWTRALSALKARGMTVGLLGAPPSRQGKYWKGGSAEESVVESGLAQDLRGKYSLPQVVGALASARAVLTLDNGIMHLAASTGTPTVALFRHGIDRLWTPPQGAVLPVVAPDGASVADISPLSVEEAILRALG
ncbi:hypothetical protein EON81_11270 [bacterium]|nr:MAG: hypothetical protein EON81_11270 [bacterium]